MINKDELDYLKFAFADLDDYSEEESSDGLNPLEYRTPEGDSCLHIAAYRGDVRAINLLVKNGLSVNAVGDMGRTALHFANLGRQKIAADTLISLGADVELKDDFRKAPHELWPR